MKKRQSQNGFTLIELLGIIIILAIIAVITVPIINKSIDNSKKSSAINSAYGYMKSVNDFYIKQIADNPDFGFEDDTYLISDLTDLGLKVTGATPTEDSWINIKNNKVYSFSLKYGDYIVIYDIDTNKAIAQKDTSKSIPKIVINTVDGVKYYNSEWIGDNPIYFNPKSNEIKCKPGTTDCMKWYAYSENADGTINMILDHNTTPRLAWVSSSDYGADNSGIPQKAKDVGLTYPNVSIENSYGLINTSASIGDKYCTDTTYCFGNWNKGPITLLKQLQIDTNSWNSTVISRDSYGSYTNKNDFYNSSNNDNSNYIINYSGYNARLITAGEVAYITGVTFDERTASSNKSFNATTYAWLLENINSGGNPAYCYWTASSFAGTSSTAWAVNYTGFIVTYFVSNDEGIGLRPVITVSNEVLLR